MGSKWGESAAESVICRRVGCGVRRKGDLYQGYVEGIGDRVECFNLLILLFFFGLFNFSLLPLIWSLHPIYEINIYGYGVFFSTTCGE